MNTVVVDTNVAVVANDKANHVSDEACINACKETLIKIIDKKNKVALDDGYRILDEYIKHFSFSGQPGVGDAFFRWIYERQACTQYVEQVHITSRDGNDFEEFPRTDDLRGFDRKDRKFVAVALASKSNPAILNATDTGWWRYRRALERCGCRIKFLCPNLMSNG